MTIHEFKKKHGKDGPPIEIDDRLVFPDGASCSIDGYGRGGEQLFDPPSDPVERLKMQHSYAFERAKELHEEFIEKKDEFSTIADNATRQPLQWEVNESCIKQLNDLKAKYQTWVGRLNKIEAELNDTPEARRKAKDEQEREEIARELSGRYQQIHRDIEAIDIDGPMNSTVTLQSHPIG